MACLSCPWFYQGCSTSCGSNSATTQKQATSYKQLFGRINWSNGVPGARNDQHMPKTLNF
eukprot:3081051-Amphidinium_carterae.1